MKICYYDCVLEYWNISFLYFFVAHITSEKGCKRNVCGFFALYKKYYFVNIFFIFFIFFEMVQK